MPRVSLEDLLATGRFGPIALRVDRGAVEAALGEPERTLELQRDRAARPFAQDGEPREAVRAGLVGGLAVPVPVHALVAGPHAPDARAVQAISAAPTSRFPGSW